MGRDVAHKAEACAAPLPLLTVDMVSAAAASLAVAPIVAMVDKAIIATASGAATSVGASLIASIQALAKNPAAFFASPEFKWIFGVYFATYATANAIGTACDLSNVPGALPVFAGTSAANVFACVSKDAAFARMFGTGKPRPLPALSYFLFFIRDSATVGASFTMPKRLSAALQNRVNAAAVFADNFAQLTSPMAVQFLSTIIHLYGLDLYNRPGEAFAERMKLVKSNYRGAVAARCGRILPAFGFGGIGNRMIRTKGRAMLASPAWQKKSS